MAGPKPALGGRRPKNQWRRGLRDRRRRNQVFLAGLARIETVVGDDKRALQSIGSLASEMPTGLKGDRAASVAAGGSPAHGAAGTGLTPR